MKKEFKLEDGSTLVKEYDDDGSVIKSEIIGEEVEEEKEEEKEEKEEVEEKEEEVPAKSKTKK